MKTGPFASQLDPEQILGFRISLLLLSMLLTIPTASAVTKTWDGSSSGNWNSSANWTNNAVPVDGDDLVFPANATRFTLTNNITGLNVKSITFNGSNYVLRGNSILLTNGIIAGYTSKTNTVELDITLGANQTFTVNTGGALEVNGDIDLGGFNLTINNLFITELGGAISGTGDLVKNRSGSLTLSGTVANTFVGTTTVNAGTLALNKNVINGAIPGDLTIGLSAGPDTVLYLHGDQINNAAVITINSGGVLDLNGFTDIIGGLIFNGGTAQAGAGTIRLNGNLTANAASTTATISGELQLPYGVVCRFVL